MFDINSFENQFVSGKIINDNGVEVNDATSSYSRYKLFLRKNVTYYIKGAWQKIYYYDMNGNLKSRSSAFNGADRNYTPSENEYIGFQIGNTYWSSNKGQEQIEQSSTSTPYTPHKEQTFTFPLGNEKLMLGDYLADDGIHHVRKQIVLDGSENWKIATDYGFGTKYTEESGYIAFSTNINHSFGVKTTTDNGNIFSNIAKVFGWFTLQNTPQIGFCIIRYDNSSTTTLWVAIPRSIASTVSSFITFLQNQNMIIENEIEESVYQSNIVPYTSAQQKIYNEIKNAYSYDEMTIITGSSDGNKPFFIVQAYKDLNKELNNKVDKVQGKELSSNDFTDVLKEKLEGLENYDDTEIKADISDIQEEQTEQNTDIEKLQTENARFKATLLTTGEVTGQDITLDKTAELEFIKPPLPMGNSEQVQYSGKNEFNKKASHFDGDYASFTELETGVRMTATGSGSGNYIWTRFVIKDLSDYVGKTVRCKASIKASANNKPNITIGLCASNGENRTQKASTSTSGELFSFEVPQFSDENTYLYIVFYANAGGSVTSGDYIDYTDVILTIDNSDMAYEPYVRTELQAHHQTIHKK